MSMKNIKEKVLNVIANTGEQEVESKFWSNVYDFLLKNTSNERRSIEEFQSKFLLLSLTMHSSSDTIRIAQIIKRYTDYCDGSHKENQKFTIPLQKSFYLDMKNLLSSGRLYDLIYYKDDIKGIDSMNLAIETADLDYTRCLIMYKRYFRVRVDEKGLKTVIDSFLYIWSHIQRNILDVQDMNRKRYAAIKEFLMYISQKRSGYPDERTKVRIVFIMKVLKAVILNQNNKQFAKKYVKCLRKFFQIIPEPYVTEAEIETFLRFLLKDAAKTDWVVNSFIDVYKELFDFESKLPFTPRTLKVLAKCAVRDNIIKASNVIQNSVKHLPLPVAVKNFLLDTKQYS